MQHQDLRLMVVAKGLTVKSRIVEDVLPFVNIRLTCLVRKVQERSLLKAQSHDRVEVK